MAKRWVAMTAVLAMLAMCGCDWWHQRKIYQQASAMTGGDPAAGKVEMRRYACAGCHEIPGLKNVPATGVTKGPALTHWFEQKTIANKVPNTPQNLIRWIQRPGEVVPGTQMPEMGITERQAKNIAAYLYTLR